MAGHPASRSTSKPHPAANHTPQSLIWDQGKFAWGILSPKSCSQMLFNEASARRESAKGKAAWRNRGTHCARVSTNQRNCGISQITVQPMSRNRNDTTGSLLHRPEREYLASTAQRTAESDGPAQSFTGLSEHLSSVHSPKPFHSRR